MPLTLLSGLLLLLVSPVTRSFTAPTSPTLSRSNTRLTMTPPAAEGSVDAQALEIIAELQAGTKTM